ARPSLCIGCHWRRVPMASGANGGLSASVDALELQKLRSPFTGGKPPVAPEPVAPEPVAPEPVAPEPVAPEPVAPEPVAPEPVAPEPVAPEPVAPERKHGTLRLPYTFLRNQLEQRNVCRRRWSNTCRSS